MPADAYTGRWLRADLEAAHQTILLETLSHTHFESAQLQLYDALECSPMAMLLGSTGVGKTRLIDTLARDANVSRSNQHAAVVVKAAAPRGQAFSWKNFWIDTLDAVADPLPDNKVDRHATAAALRSGRPAALRHSTEDTLRRSVTSAARNRSLEILYIDEAASLLKSGNERVLKDQLDVLRDLADHGEFKIVLVSTPAILESLDASGELLRRIDEVFFLRYRRNGPTGQADYTSFRRILKSLLKHLPEQTRFKPSKAQETLLYAGSLGGIGHLSRWLRRALVRCDRARAERLKWDHFEETGYSDKKLGQLYKHAEADDEIITDWTERTHCQAPAPENLGAPDARLPQQTKPGKDPNFRSRAKRVGSPRPTRRSAA